MIKTERSRVVVDGDAQHEFSADQKSVFKLPPDSLTSSDLTIAWILRNLSPSGRQKFDATVQGPEWSKLKTNFSALSTGTRTRSKPEEFYASYPLNTPVISTGYFTTDGQVILDCGEFLSKAEFECLYRTTAIEHLTEHAKERASTIRAFLQLEQAAPVVFDVTYTSDDGVGSKKLVARSRDHVVKWLKQHKLKALDWTEDER